MTDKFVQVSPDSTGKKIRTEEVVIGPDTVEQQTVTLADSSGNLLDTQLNNLNLSLTSLRDAITAVGGAAKTLADVVTAIQATTKPADQQHAIVDSGTLSVSNLATATAGSTAPSLGDVVAGTDGGPPIVRVLRTNTQGEMMLDQTPDLLAELRSIRAGIMFLVNEYGGDGADLIQTVTEDDLAS